MNANVDVAVAHPGLASLPDRHHRKVALASLVGTSLEWYDYFIFGACAALLFPQLFFPGADPLTGKLAAFATMAVGMIARPLGAAVVGHYGDRIGRKTMLVLSLLIMGASTLLIGLLPTYASIGLWAPALLCLLRLVQGFSCGGEWGAAVVMAVEHAPRQQRGLYGSFPQVGVPVGMLLATGAFSLLSQLLSEQQLLAWGWRIPFLASVVLVGIGIFVRLSVHESPLFQAVKARHVQFRTPALEVFRHHRRPLLATTGMRILQNAVYYLYTVFMLGYIADTLHLNRTVGLNAVLLSSVIGLAALPGWAWLSDRIGRRRVTLFGTIGSALFIVPFFLLADSGNVWLLTLGMVIGLNLMHDAVYGPQAVYFAELFTTRVRLSGVNLGYAIGSVLGGGLAPMIATALLAAAGGRTWGISLYVIGLGLISTLAVLAARETRHEALDG